MTTSLLIIKFFIYIFLTYIFANFRNLLCLYFIYFFNILYYKIAYNNIYKTLDKFKEKKYKDVYYTYVSATSCMDIILMRMFSRFFYTVFFSFFYFIYIWKIIQIEFYFFFNCIQKFLVFFITIFNWHYSLIMKAHILKDNIYKKNQFIDLYQFKFLRRYSVYNTFFFFFLLYLKSFLIDIYDIIFNLYLWIMTYYIRFINKFKRNLNTKYSIKYNIKIYKNKFILKSNDMYDIIVDKIYKNYNIKITLKYYYNKTKTLCLNMFTFMLLKITNFILMIKEFYFKKIVNVIFFKILKNKGNLIIYYIFLFFKYFKSYLIWLWESDKIYNFLKLFERKKW